MMKEPEISIQGVDRRFGTFVALRQVSLDIYKGEVHVLLGPSGCGKTTLLRMIAGFEKPDAGRILHEGRVVEEPGPQRGFVFQENVHFPWRTVVRNVEFGLEMRGIAPAERRKTADQYLHLVGLDGFADYFPSQVSGGMKQRMVLAAVLANDPKALLMDEPFAALDAQTRTNMQKELVRIWAETRKTIIFVTHSIREALVIGSRISLFKTRPGEIKQLFDLDEMFGVQQERQLADSRFGKLEAEIYELMRQDEVKVMEALPAA
jgi:NitT/TauT family transport system ATP-binding protein